MESGIFYHPRILKAQMGKDQAEDSSIVYTLFSRLL